MRWMMLLAATLCMAAAPTTKPAKLRDDTPANVRRYFELAEEARVEQLKAAREVWDTTKARYAKLKRARIVEGKSEGEDKQGYHFPDKESRQAAWDRALERVQDALADMKRLEPEDALGDVWLMGLGSPYKTDEQGAIGRVKKISVFQVISSTDALVKITYLIHVSTPPPRGLSRLSPEQRHAYYESAKKQYERTRSPTQSDPVWLSGIDTSELYKGAEVNADVLERIGKHRYQNTAGELVATDEYRPIDLSQWAIPDEK